MRNHLSSSLLIGLITLLGNAVAAERVLTQVSLGPLSSTAPNTSIRYALAENTDHLYLQTDAPQMLFSPSRRGVLANVYVRDPQTTIFSSVSASGGNAQAVGLVGTDASGRYLAVQANCRLDYFGSGDCAPIPGAAEQGGAALFLIDRQSGDAKLISHRNDEAQTPVLETEAFEDVRIAENGRYVYFHSRGTGLADDTPTAPGSRRLYVYDLTLRRSRRADQLPGDTAAPTDSSVLWSRPDGLQALVQVDSQRLLVVAAATGRVTQIGPADLGPGSLTASDQGKYVLRCRNYINAPSGIRFLQWSRITLADESVLTLNAPPPGFALAGACPNAGRLSDDGNVATVNVLQPTLDPGSQRQPEQLVQWRLNDGRQTLISRRHDAPAQASSGRFGILDVSSDGRLVVFSSDATDLLAEPSGSAVDAIYVYDRSQDRIKLVSANKDAPNVPKRGDSAQLNRAGTMIYFLSADSLSSSTDANQSRDLFAYRIADGEVLLLSSRQAAGTPLQRGAATHPVLSRDGYWLAYEDTGYSPRYGGPIPSPVTQQVLVNRAGGGIPTLVSRRRGALTEGADRDSSVIGFSADARYLAFRSLASDLDTEIPYQRLGPDPDTFILDRDTNVISLVTHPIGGPLSQSVGRGQSVAVDASGEWILHATDQAAAFVPGFVDTSGIAANSMLVLMPTRGTAAPVLISRAALNRLTGADRPARHLAHSPDLNLIAFASAASNLVDTVVQTSAEQLYVHDRVHQTTRWLTRSVHTPTQAANGVLAADAKTLMSADGRYVAFSHSGSDLFHGVEDGPQTFDCYRYDLSTGQIALVSDQTLSSQHAYCNGISDDGRYVLYTEVYPDVPASANQVWRQDVLSGTRDLVSLSDRNTPAFGGATGVHLSADGRQALFLSPDSGLISQASPGQADNLYLRTIDDAVTTLISDGTSPGVNPAASTLNSVTASDDFSTIAFADTSSTLETNVLDLNDYSDIFVSRSPGLSGNPGLSGLWGEAGVDGQGFHLVNLPDSGRMLLTWYTYLPLGSTPTRTNQQWLIGTGELQDGIASFAVSVSNGGEFDSVFGGTQGEVGAVTIRFLDCQHAEARYSIGVSEPLLTGVIPLTRLSPDTVCVAYKRLGQSALAEIPRPANSRWQYGMSGAWHDESKPGQGFLMEVLPRSNQVIATWFTFDPGQSWGPGRQAPLWLAAIGEIHGDRAQLEVYESSNGQFDRAGGNQLRSVGTLDLDAIDCQTSAARYAVTLGGVARSGQIPLSRITSSELCSTP